MKNIFMFQHLSEFRIGSMRRTHIQTNSVGKVVRTNKIFVFKFSIDQLKQKKCIFVQW